jgi:hypothetical protein
LPTCAPTFFQIDFLIEPAALCAAGFLVTFFSNNTHKKGYKIEQTLSKFVYKLEQFNCNKIPKKRYIYSIRLLTQQLAFNTLLLKYLTQQ